MSNHKMKSLLKGLRYISQIFENEKEPEMQIGNPTDVKHVAHIGWDGGSADPPSWMNDFKSPAGLSSTPLPDINEDSSWVSEGSSRKGTRDLPGLPKSSRRSSTAGSPTKEKTDKSKRRSSNPDGSSRSSRRSKETSSQRDESLPKSRRKKSKESVNGGSSRSSRRARRSENGSENGSTSETGSVASISQDMEERRLP